MQLTAHNNALVQGGFSVKKRICIILLAALLLSGCQASEQTQAPETQPSNVESTTQKPEEVAAWNAAADSLAVTEVLPSPRTNFGAPVETEGKKTM